MCVEGLRVAWGSFFVAEHSPPPSVQTAFRQVLHTCSIVALSIARVQSRVERRILGESILEDPPTRIRSCTWKEVDFGDLRLYIQSFSLLSLFCQRVQILLPQICSYCFGKNRVFCSILVKPIFDSIVYTSSKSCQLGNKLTKPELSFYLQM